MGTVKTSWLLPGHSGRPCRHEDIYTKQNKKTGAVYSVKLCNPAQGCNAIQATGRNAFGVISSAVSDWIKTNREANSADYLAVKKQYDRQNKFASLRGFMMHLGMYTVSQDGMVSVSISARTDFKAIRGNVQGATLPTGNNGTTTPDPNTQQPTPDTQKRTLTLSADPGIGGTVTGAGEYNDGATANISATPASGYKFVRWSDGNTSASRTVTMTEDRVLTAQFQVDSEGDNAGW